MLTFNNLKEMRPYYIARADVYAFEDDIDIQFDLNIKSDIKAYNIKAKNIDTYNIDAWSIKADTIDALNLVCNSIKGKRENSFYKCLDGEMVIRNERK